jgi:hypothetical protein
MMAAAACGLRASAAARFSNAADFSATTVQRQIQCRDQGLEMQNDEPFS